MPEMIAAPIAESLLAETATAALLPEMAAAGATLTSLGSAAIDPLLAGLTAGAGAYGEIGLASLLNPATQAATQGIASNFMAPNYLAQLGNAGVAPIAEAAAPLSGFQTATNQGILSALQPAQAAQALEIPAVSPVEVMQAPVNAVPELSNIAQSPYSFDPNAAPINLTPPETSISPIDYSTNAANTMERGLANGRPQDFARNEWMRSTEPLLRPEQSIKEAQNLAPTNPYSIDANVPEQVLTAPDNYQQYSELPPTSESTFSPTFRPEIQGKPGVMSGSAWDDLKTLAAKPNWQAIKNYASEHPYWTAGAGLLAYNALKPKPIKVKEEPQYIRPYRYTRAINPNVAAYQPYSNASTAERNWFTGGLEALPIYRAAKGGLTSLAVGGPVETMAAMNAVGENLGYPQANYQTDIYSNPNVQRPEAMNMIAPSGDVAVDQYTGEQKFADGGSTGEAGGYQYSYDPVTMQFTQLSDPAYEAAQQATQAPAWNSIGQRFQPQAQPVNPNSWYGVQTQPKVQAPKPFAPVVTGGIAQLTNPADQTVTAPVQQPAPQVSNVPAYQTPEQQLGLTGFYDYMNQQLSGMRGQQGMAAGGLSNLGGYSDGGRLLKGPGDGVSDSIPASIGDRQPARLADGEFVVPARIVSEIGNGSTEAGARKLYAMMDRVQKARKKSTGKDSVAVNSRAEKYLPA